MFFFHYNVSSVQTVGTEFAFDYQKKVVESRLGFAHKFNNETSSKVKINQAGYLDLALKHKLSDLLTVGLTTGFSLRRIISEHKTGALPLGFSLDLKF